MKEKNYNQELPPSEVDPVELPENAFRQLGEDEEYRPLMHPAHDYPEDGVRPCLILPRSATVDDSSNVIGG